MEQVMTINKIKKLIQNDYQRRQDIITAKRYYNNDNDIKLKGILPESSDPLRNADNRMSNNFHEDFTDEKSSYMFTNPVLFDLGDKDTNNRVKEVLGDDFEYESNNLCVNATNCKVGWLHYWIDEDEKIPFQYATVETEEIIPVFKKGLKRKLQAIHRYYEDYEEDNNGKIKYYTWYEYWDDKHCERYKFRGRATQGTGLAHLPQFDESFGHNFETVPFIEFRNNKKQESDLKKYKDLLDIYDKVMSGFANDLEDIQQLIYILENYGGEDLKEFTQNLKRFKAVKTGTNEKGVNGDLRTLQIEIPVEARKAILEILEKRIYKAAQSLDMDNSNFGNSSGVALKFFYRKLELKAGLMQIEFKRGFNQLIRAILKYLGITEYKTIIQTWTRNMISNDLENAQIATQSQGIISDETIIKNHPWVENPEDEIKKIKAKQQEEENEYNKMIKELNKNKTGNTGEDDSTKVGGK